MRFVSLSFFCLFIFSCSSTVNVDYDKNFNFNQLKSFLIQEKPIRISPDTRVNSPFMQQRVFQEINTAMFKKGFVKKDKNIELEIKYYLDIKKEIESYGSEFSVGFGSFGRHSAVGFGLHFPPEESRSIDKLVLTIDIFLKQSNKLVWRGSAEELLENGSTPESYTVLVRQLVSEVLNEFPPK